MLARGFLCALITQHAGDFIYALLFLKRAERADWRPFVRVRFEHTQMLMAPGRNLGQVGHAEHLAVLAQAAQHLAHGVGHIAPDA